MQSNFRQAVSVTLQFTNFRNAVTVVMSKSSSRVKATAGGTSLVLQTRHRLRVGSTEIIGRLSDKIDVILAASGTLSIAFRGILHEKPISAAVLLSSQLAQHLVEYFHAVCAGTSAHFPD